MAGEDAGGGPRDGPGGEAAGGVAARGGGRRAPAVLSALFVLLVAAILALGLVSAYAGWALTHPPRQPVQGDPATGASLDYRCLPQVLNVFCGPLPLFTARHHIPISAWILPSAIRQEYPGPSGDWSSATVVLVPNHGESRTPAALPVWKIASLLVAEQYNVVMYDPRGTGDSGGAGIGFGTIEVRDLITVVDYLQELGGAPQGHIAVWGFGTGADTAILAAARDRNIQAVIADSPYVTPGEYLRRRVPAWTGLPRFPFTAGVLWAMQVETDVRYSAFNAVTAAAQLGGRNPRPLLLVVGQDDAVTPPADAERIYRAAGSRAYNPYVVPGAGHLQAYAKSPPDQAVPALSQYDCLVLNTLRAMQNGSGNAAPGGSAGPCGAASPSGGAAAAAASG